MSLAVFVKSAALPRREYAFVALCKIPLQEIESRHKVRSRKSNVQAQGGSCRFLVTALANGRYAYLETYDARPETVEIYIETFRIRFAYRADLEAVSELIGIPISAFSWLVSDDVIRFR